MAKRRTINQQIYDDIVDYLVSQGVSLEEIPDAPPRITLTFLEEMMRFRQEIDQMAKEADTYRAHLESIVNESQDRYRYGEKGLYLYDELEHRLGSVKMIARMRVNAISQDLIAQLEKATNESKQPEAFDGYATFRALLDSIEETDTDVDSFFIDDDYINTSPEDELEADDEYDGDDEEE